MACVRMSVAQFRNQEAPGGGDVVTIQRDHGRSVGLSLASTVRVTLVTNMSTCYPQRRQESQRRPGVGACDHEPLSKLDEGW